MAVPALKIVPADVVNDPARLEALERYDVLDTPREEAFERIVNLMRLVLKTDVSIVSLIDSHRQWYKAGSGNDASEVPVSESFCRITIEGDSPLAVTDATQDARFRDNPHVTGEAHIRAYLGVPIRTPDGFNIGTLCAFSRTPQEFSSEQQAIVAELAKVAMNELELRQLATSDGLTGIMTRRAFREDGARMLSHARRHRSGVSAVTLDIDHFKQINDTYGHAAGDQVLKAVSKAVAGQLRQSDLFGRVGGEEFAIILPDTDIAGALEAAEKLRATIRGLKFPGSHPPMGITASFGVAPFDPGERRSPEPLGQGRRGTLRSQARRPQPQPELAGHHHFDHQAGDPPPRPQSRPAGLQQPPFGGRLHGALDLGERGGSGCLDHNRRPRGDVAADPLGQARKPGPRSDAPPGDTRTRVYLRPLAQRTAGLGLLLAQPLGAALKFGFSVG